MDNMEQKVSSLPLWAKIVIGVATAGLAVGGFFTLRAIRKSKANKVTVNEQPEEAHE